MSFIEKLLEGESSHCKELAKKNKDLDSFEDNSKKLEAQTWSLLYHMSPIQISPRPLIVDLKSGGYEIDVFAEFDDVLIVAECKSGESHDVNGNIDKIKANKGDLQNYLRGEFSTEKPCIFILVYSDQILPIASFKKAKKSNIEIWNEYLLNEYSAIANKLKQNSQQIILSDLLAQKKQQWGRGKKKFNCLVTKGSYKGNDCYSFQMSPETLLKIAYVHRRNFFNALNEEEITYQRMIDLNKIKSIQKFLNTEGNSFPTPILINFEKELEFSSFAPRSSEKRGADITPGWLTIPEEYGYAWIIDGQHRLFGYSGLKQIAKKHMLNVVAFSKLSPAEQANLFVEINQNQKSIPPEYLWDLFTDIYPKEDDRYKISKLVKNLNKKSAFFKERVYIPSLSVREKKHYNLKINNIGVSFKAKAPSVYKLLLDKNIDEYYKLLDRYFSQLINSKEAGNDWNQGDKGFICSNNGIGVMTYVLNNFHQYLIECKLDMKHLSSPKIYEELSNFTAGISRALRHIGFERLNSLKKVKSSEAGRRSIANEIIIVTGQYDHNFKELANEAFLTQISEDLNNEFKETLSYNIKTEKYDMELFEEAILGTICAFINAGVEGNLYIGVGDDKKFTGINKELTERFKGSLDEMFLFIGSKIESNLLVKDFPKQEVNIEVFKTKDLVLKIHVPNTEMGTAIVKTGKGYRSWIKRISRKTELTKMKDSNLKIELNDEVRYNNHNALVSGFYRDLNATK